MWLFNSKTILFVSLDCIKILEVRAIRDGGLQVQRRRSEHKDQILPSWISRGEPQFDSKNYTGVNIFLGENSHLFHKPSGQHSHPQEQKADKTGGECNWL